MPFDPLPPHVPHVAAHVDPSEHGWYVTLWVGGEQVEDWRWCAHRSTRWGAKRKARQLLSAWMSRVETPRLRTRGRDAKQAFVVMPGHPHHDHESNERLWPWAGEEPGPGDPPRPRPH